MSVDGMIFGCVMVLKGVVSISYTTCAYRILAHFEDFSSAFTIALGKKYTSFTQENSFS